MKMYDCDVCLSAGSVNQWGYCEICGEEFEDPESLVNWHQAPREVLASSGAITSSASSEKLFTTVGQDAA